MTMETSGVPGCTCDEITNPCDACRYAHLEVIQQLYATDPAFRAELRQWVPLDSPEGQRIISSL